ncbi:hypothetical protein [Mangrovibacterium marinum]|uniref:hypothetical protein n=1 Tax=Mangrovibacterium marinum TaxID=1639118 RepID=UPI002A18DA8C|nr:hypothetical protein [Mangrovibacterium marinum]
MVKEKQGSVPGNKYHFVEQQLLDSLAFEKQLLDLLSNKIAQIDEEGAYTDYTAALSDLLSCNLQEEHISSFLPTHNDLTDLHALLETFDELHVAEQAAERFHSQPGDAAGIRLQKLGKRLALKLGWGMQWCANLLRTKKKAKRYWKHQIPRARLAEYVYVIGFCELLQPFYADFLKDREQRIRQFYLLDREIEQYRLRGGEKSDWSLRLADIEDSLEERMTLLKQFFAGIDEQLDEQFIRLSEKAGTIEFSNKRISAKKIARGKAKVFKQLDGLLEAELLVFFAIGEHWRLKLQNRSLIFRFNEQSAENASVLLEQINQTLKPAFILLKKELSGFASVDKQQWAPEKLETVSEYVEKQIPGLVQLVYQARLVNVFDRPLVQLEEAVGKSAEMYQFAAPAFAAKPVSRKLFHKIATRELIRGGILEPLKKEFDSERKKLLVLVQKLTTNLEEIRYTTNYSVDFYRSQQGTEEAAGELKAGLERTVKKADEMMAYLAAMAQLVEAVFQQQGKLFTEQLIQYFEPQHLQRTEKKNQRREAAARRKALMQQYFKKSVSLAKHYFHLLKSLHSAFYHRYFNLKSLLGISYVSEPISTELSNYLSETKQAIARLPLMYQKLYENVPLTEDRFYTPRRPEMQQLNAAFANWQDGRFSPVCLVGEQGSGTTTLFNFFEQSIAAKYPTIRLALNENQVEDHRLFELLRTLSNDTVVTDIDELIDQINRSNERRVVFLENIHNLFLRNSGDFGNLFLLFKLISQTNQQIFWVTSCYLYSWKLLNYTNSIAAYFAHIIEFSPFSSDQIRDLILKRHQLSGFSLRFLEPEGFSPKRNFLKMDDEQQQTFLKDVFFEELGAYAQSNLRLAFIYWLRAISQVENGEISIRTKRIDFSFLNSLKTPELTTLHSILIHGGLGQKEHSRIFRCSTEASFRSLMVLTDDGLLEKQGAIYRINPLVYRVLVSQLKSLNFIY